MSSDTLSFLEPFAATRDVQQDRERGEAAWDGSARETKAALGRMRRKSLGLRVGLTYRHTYKLVYLIRNSLR
jgi:hypothetical protein